MRKDGLRAMGWCPVKYMDVFTSIEEAKQDVLTYIHRRDSDNQERIRPEGRSSAATVDRYACHLRATFSELGGRLEVLVCH